MNHVDKFISFILDVEGGERYTHDPVDLGGETKWGISKAAHPTLDIKTLSKSEAINIYRTEYYKQLGLDKFGHYFAFACMDAAVNHGASNLKTMIRPTLGLGKTAGWQAIASAYNQRVTGSKEEKVVQEIMLTLQLITQRKLFYDDIVRRKPAQRKYLKGWRNRLLKNLQFVSEMVNNDERIS